jgi:Fe2+ transport system protein FeoA
VSEAADKKQPLAAMKQGEQGELVSFLHPEHQAMLRLISLGFLPGEIFTLERRSPDYLIRFGYTRIAISRSLAWEILVHKVKVPSICRRRPL